MGTLVRLTAYAAADPAAAFREAFGRIADLDSKLSDYKPDSELNRLCRARTLRVSADLLAVLKAAQQLAAESDGAFDITEGPVIRLWRETRRTHQLPAPAALIQAADRTGYRNLHIERDTVHLDLPNMQLDLGGIAKGYAADQALAVLRRRGITQALVAVSGDLAIGDPPPGKSGWRIGVGSSQRTASLANCGVSTSGDTEQFVEIDGTRYSHIIDPHTHTPLTESFLETVIARHGIEADALATALSVLDPVRGRQLLAAHPGASATRVVR
jgi:thiamine biosynthesis lipoprotein